MKLGQVKKWFISQFCKSGFHDFQYHCDESLSAYPERHQRICPDCGAHEVWTGTFWKEKN